MQADSDVNGVAKYARQTRRRMAFALHELGVVEPAGLSDTHRLSGWMEAQEKASRAAGFVGIARLCETVNECLAGLRRGERPVLVPIIGTLMEVCRTVRLHAETVARQAQHGAEAGGPDCSEGVGKGPDESNNVRALPLFPRGMSSSSTVPSA